MRKKKPSRKFLERAGKFVFHGSPNINEKLEPRQQMQAIDREKEILVEDGVPSVCATESSQIATFRAITASLKGQSGYYSAIYYNPIKFELARAVARDFSLDKGYVYSLDREKFNHERGSEWRSQEPVKPTLLIEVTGKDLPENIELVDN